MPTIASRSTVGRSVPDRLACIDIPALPLQLLLQAHPDWAGHPVAVVDEDKPQGLIRWVNGAARKVGILPGLRYGTALGLSGELRAGTVSTAAMSDGVEALIRQLRQWSPEVEPSITEPGVFWLDAGGLEHLFPSLAGWADDLRQDLKSAGYVAAIAVGFSRFGTYAVARALRGRRNLVFADPRAEDKAVVRVPLSLIELPPASRDALLKLGVTRIGEFRRLPPDGVLRRFGPDVHQLHRFALGSLDPPLRPRAPQEPIRERVGLDYAEPNLARLVFLLKRIVDPLLVRLARRGEALAGLLIGMELDGGGWQEERVRPAEPTLASVPVMELVRLRLEALTLSAPVVGVVLTAEGLAATVEQLKVFAEVPKRDLAAAARAFARLRATYGEDVVVKAVLADRHLPEASFAWKPLDRLPLPTSLPGEGGPLVRGGLAKPQVLPDSDPRHSDGWLLRGIEHGPVARMIGPYRISGGWWRQEIQREYYFAEMRDGELLWVYYDPRRRGWLLQGMVR